jgi:pimeloyl-ACP methyl ester carboxylesterase
MYPAIPDPGRDAHGRGHQSLSPVSAPRRGLEDWLVPAILAIAVAACGMQAGGGPSAPAASPTPAPSAPARTMAGRPMLACEDFGLPARCGLLSVPEDRTEKNGRPLNIFVVIVPATDPTAAAGTAPLFLLAGGPGGAATQSFEYAMSAYPELRRTRDFVMVDQRGTGTYGALGLAVKPDLTGLDVAAAEAAVATAMTESLRQVSQIADPRLYTSWDAAQDLDAVRAALGYDQIDLFGGSYGATMAQVYLALYPEHVRTVTVSGVSLLDVPLFEHSAVGAQEAFDKMVGRCSADAACHAAYPNVRAEFKAVLAGLAAKPVVSSVANPENGKPIVVDANVFTSAVADLLVSVNLAATLPRAIHHAAAGDLDLIARTYADFSDGRMSLLMGWTIRCSEAWAAMDPDATARKGGDSFLTPAMTYTARMLRAGCSVFPKAAVPAIDGQAVHSDKPVLFLVGGADPADPPENSAAAPIIFPNSVTALFPAGGHAGNDTYGCAPELITQFITSGSAKGLDVSCAAKAPIPAFDVRP